jgi:hypothetical protein
MSTSSHRVIRAVAMLLTGLPCTVVLAQSGWQANPDVVRRTAEQQPKFNYDEARVGTYTLPDPLAGKDGVVRTSDAWTSASCSANTSTGVLQGNPSGCASTSSKKIRVRCPELRHSGASQSSARRMIGSIGST